MSRRSLLSFQHLTSKKPGRRARNSCKALSALFDQSEQFLDLKTSSSFGDFLIYFIEYIKEDHSLKNYQSYLCYFLQIIFHRYPSFPESILPITTILNDSLDDLLYSTLVTELFDFFLFCVSNNQITIEFFMKMFSNRSFFEGFVKLNLFIPCFKFLFLTEHSISPENLLLSSGIIFENAPIDLFGNVDYESFYSEVLPLICLLLVPENYSEAASFFFSHLFNRLASNYPNFSIYFLEFDGFVTFDILLSTLPSSIKCFNYEQLLNSPNSDLSSAPNLYVLLHLSRIYLAKKDMRLPLFTLVVNSLMEHPECVVRMNETVKFSFWLQHSSNDVSIIQEIELLHFLNSTGNPKYVKDCLPFIFSHFLVERCSDIQPYEICLNIIYFRRFSLQFLASLNFLSVFVIEINKNTFISLLSKESEFSQLIIDIYSLDEAKYFQNTVFHIFVEIFDQANVIPNYYEILSTLLIISPSKFVIQEILNKIRLYPVLEKAFLKSIDVTNIFIKELNGLDWIYSNFYSETPIIFFDLFSAIVSLCQFKEVDEFVANNIRIFEQNRNNKDLIEKLVYGNNKSHFKPIRIPSIFYFIEDNSISDFYNLHLIGKFCFEKIISNTMKQNVMKRYIPDIVKNSISSKRGIPIINYLHQNIQEFIQLPMKDFLPIYQFYQGRSAELDFGEFNNLSFIFKCFQHELDNKLFILRTDDISVYIKKSLLIISVNGIKQRIEYLENDWNYVELRQKGLGLIIKINKKQKLSFDYSHKNSLHNCQIGGFDGDNILYVAKIAVENIYRKLIPGLSNNNNIFFVPYHGIALLFIDNVNYSNFLKGYSQENNEAYLLMLVKFFRLSEEKIPDFFDTFLQIYQTIISKQRSNQFQEIFSKILSNLSKLTDIALSNDILLNMMIEDNFWSFLQLDNLLKLIFYKFKLNIPNQLFLLNKLKIILVDHLELISIVVNLPKKNRSFIKVFLSSFEFVENETDNKNLADVKSKILFQIQQILENKQTISTFDFLTYEFLFSLFLASQNFSLKLKIFTTMATIEKIKPNFIEISFIFSLFIGQLTVYNQTWEITFELYENNHDFMPFLISLTFFGFLLTINSIIYSTYEQNPILFSKEKTLIHNLTKSLQLILNSINEFFLNDIAMNIFRCIFPFLFSYSDLCQDNKIPIQSSSISFMMYFISNIFDDYSTDFHQNSSILNPGNLIEYIQSSKMIKFLITLLMSCPITVFESIFIPIVIDISNNEQPKIFISHFIIKLLKRLEEKEKICIVLQYIGHLLITNCITTSHESILGYLFDKVEYFTGLELNLINKILIYIFIKSLKKPAQIILSVIEQNISKFIRIIKIFPEDWGVCLSISKSYMKNHEFNHFISLINVLNPSFRIEINLHSILGKDENYDRMLINYFKLNELKQDYSRFQVYIFSTIDEYASTYSRYLHNH